jgi:type VI protein secretion system component VasF
VSPLELVDDRFEKLAEELRAARPVAPEALRQRVRALEPQTRRGLELNVPWRRLAPAVAIAVLAAVVGVAGVLGIVHGASSPRREALAPVHVQKQLVPRRSVPEAQDFGAAKLAPSPIRGRLERYDAALRVRVDSQTELSKRTQDAMRLTRRLGGYVAWANYSTPSNRGDSELQLQIPIDKVQAAIAAFSGYGTLVGQRIRLNDLQQRADDLTVRIQRLRARIARLNDPRDRARLAELLRARVSTVKRAQMASVALAMVVGKKQAAAPASRFDRTVDDAGSVLARELEILLYALVVAGPLLAIGGAGILAGRAIRRRSNERLLERS